MHFFRASCSLACYRGLWVQAILLLEVSACRIIYLLVVMKVFSPHSQFFPQKEFFLCVWGFFPWVCCGLHTLNKSVLETVTSLMHQPHSSVFCTILLLLLYRQFTFITNCLLCRQLCISGCCHSVSYCVCLSLAAVSTAMLPNYNIDKDMFSLYMHAWVYVGWTLFVHAYSIRWETEHLAHWWILHS